ncbi:hypothetical protein CA51_48050 [Rosistilla oblonga]|nr:hypothetical protein CA51_48050 [Rosistilla oblonga]
MSMVLLCATTIVTSGTSRLPDSFAQEIFAASSAARTSDVNFTAYVSRAMNQVSPLHSRGTYLISSEATSCRTKTKKYSMNLS